MPGPTFAATCEPPPASMRPQPYRIDLDEASLADRAQVADDAAGLRQLQIHAPDASTVAGFFYSTLSRRLARTPLPHRSIVGQSASAWRNTDRKWMNPETAPITHAMAAKAPKNAVMYATV